MGPQFAVAHYQATAKLGQGGMGEVWRATDTKLARDVALKILPEALAGDPDRMTRFAREAQVLASLNHPNIAAIYGVEERVLVMELVEGPTLAERIADGPLPLEEALPIARQIAEALEYAHEKGVIHRDLKPANIKVTPEGRVKVLDFGLAKALGTEPAGSDSMSSPTLTMRATLAGTIMGTAAYMSPEQAKGKPVDRRADIWAFGIVTVEMLTARMMFSGETVSETLAAVIMKEPDLGGLPDATPASIRGLLVRCLDRDPRCRLRDIGEARIALQKYLANPAAEAGAGEASLPPARSGSPWRWIAAALSIAVAALAVWLWRGTTAVNRPWMHFSATLAADAIPGTYITVAISHDGTRIVFPVRTSQGTQLATRLMDQAKATVLAGTERAEQPFFSPDDEWIGFFADGKMKKISVRGGAPFIICDAPSARGASWGEKGEIFANIDLVHLSRVPAAGGTPQIVGTPKEQGRSLAPASYRYPQVLPGGDAVLVSAGTAGLFEDASVGVLSLKTGALKIVHQGGYYGRYLPSGHLIFIRQGTLYAAPFDLKRMELRAAPVPVLQEIAANPGPGTAQLDISGAGSGTGTLVYVAGKGGAAQQLAWMDATGKQTPLLTTTVPITPRLSPDGKLIAVSSKRDISVYDPQRGASTQITFTAEGNNNPVWAPDGKHLVYASPKGIWWTRADGSSQPVRLLEATSFATPGSFTPDGKLLAFQRTGEGRAPDICVLPIDSSDLDHPKPGTPQVVVRSELPEMDPAFSPDGRWMAYVSAESGDLQVYVRPYPAQGGKWHISTSSGRFPVWSRNGKELFYETLDGRIMVVEYTTKDQTFSAGMPRQWSTTPIFVTGPYQNLDLAPDGKRFVTISGESAVFGESSGVHAVFVVNFFDELKRRLP